MFFSRFFKKKTVIEPEPKTPVFESKPPHDYGLWAMNMVLCSHNYGWSNPKPCKKVILTNPKECEGNITLDELVRDWQNTGHKEWEYILAGWFIHAVIDAIKENQEEADITRLFNRDFYTRDSDLVFTQEDVYNHLIPSFDIIDENDSELRVKFKLS